MKCRKATNHYEPLYPLKSMHVREFILKAPFPFMQVPEQAQAFVRNISPAGGLYDPIPTQRFAFSASCEVSDF